MDTFQNYLTKRRSLTIEEMQDIHERILNSVDGDQKALEIYTELLKKAARYSNIRANWHLWSTEERREKDDSRTSSHDSVITQLNMLSRWLAKQGKDTSWREELGDEESDRKRIGDFACYLAFVSALNAR